MLRFFINLLLICGAAVLISMQDGTVLLELPDQTIEFDVQTGLALLLIAGVWWWSVAKLWFFIKYGFSRRHEKRLRVQHEQGLTQLTHSMNYLASGNLRQAQKAVKKAHKLLGDVPMALWLEAELAARRGESMAAQKLYQTLAATPEGAVLGWRGLLQQQPHLHRGQGAEVLRLTQQALAVDSIAQQDFAHELRIMAYAQQGNWAEAILALHHAVRHNAFSKPRARSLNTVLSFMHSQNLSSHGLPHDKETELRQLRLAYKESPDFIPVAAAYAMRLSQAGEINTAFKVISATWLIAPHLDLLTQYQLMTEGEDALLALQRFERFAIKRKDHAATHIALARLCLAARIVGKARSHAASALAIASARECYLLLADIAQIEQESDSDYERRAINAAPIGLYMCDACNYATVQWQAICPHCDKVATLQWEEKLNERIMPVLVPEEPMLIA